MSFDSIIVQQNFTIPEGVVAIVQDTLTCKQNTVALTGISNTNGVTYKWFGPNHYNSTEQNPFVTKPGFYRLVVTSQDNGCSSSDIVLVEQNYSYPDSVSATVSGILTCNDTLVTLTGVTGSNDVSYFWSDKNGFKYPSSSIDISVPGIYNFIVSDKISGCKDSINILVEQDTEPPLDLMVSVTDTLNCMITKTTLSATSTTDDVVYHWKGPQENTFSNKQSIVTNQAGIYHTTATNTQNNCNSEGHATVVAVECK
jgi:hypothetical protein